MRCSQAQKLIPLLSNNELEDSQRRKVDGHLRRCETCKRVADEYVALAHIAKIESQPVEPDGFYDNFYDEVLVRVNQRNKPPEKSSVKRFEWPALRPKLAFAGIGVAIAVVVFALFSTFKNDAPRITLETYLMQRDFAALSRAVADDRQRPELMNDSVSVDLLIKSLKVLDKMNTGYGQVALNMAPVIAMLQQEISKKQTASTEHADRSTYHKLLRAGSFDFKKTIRALHLINRPGVKVTLIDLAKYRTYFHRQV